METKFIEAMNRADGQPFNWGKFMVARFTGDEWRRRSHDLNEKHKIWVCPLYEPFLEWLYRQDVRDLGKLPDHVTLEAPAALWGYRRDRGGKAP